MTPGNRQEYHAEREFCQIGDVLFELSSPKRVAALLALILIGAFGLRCGAAVWWQGHLPPGQEFGFGDSEGYWRLARSIAHGQPYSYPTDEFHVFRAPGYPLLLTPLMACWEEEPPTLIIRCYSALLATIGAGGVFWLGKELFNTRVGLLAAIGVACDPGLVALGALLLSDGPAAALLPIQMTLWIKGWRAKTKRSRVGYLLLAGATAGVITLIRPSWLLFTPFALVLALIFSQRRKEHLLTAPWLLLGLALVMAPWWIRNYQVTGHFVMTTLQVGASLYDGQSPQATGASNMDFVPAGEARLKAADAARRDAHLPPESDSFEYRLNQMFLREAVDWASQHPLDSLRLAGVKFLRVWNIWPNEAQFRRPLIRVAVLVSFVPTFTLALIGLWRFRQLGWPVVLLVLPAVYFSILHMIFVSSIRYRLPAMLLLYVLAAATIDAWWQSRKMKIKKV